MEKTTGLVFMKIGGGLEHGPRKNPLHFGEDKGRIHKYFFLFLTSWDRAFDLLGMSDLQGKHRVSRETSEPQ